MSKKNLVQVTTDQRGNEVVMVRVDKTLKELMEEKPIIRIDAAYWHPKYEGMLSLISKKYLVEKFKTYLSRCDQGDGLRTKKGDKYIEDGIPMVSVIDIKLTGINYHSLRHIVESHYKRIANAQPNYGDILIVRSGEGSIGKSAIFLGKPMNKKIGITGHINTLGFKGINPFYVEVYLKTIFGQSQIDRYESGVSGQTEFTQDSISEIKIPVLSIKVQEDIESEYKKMAVYHDKAMEAKKNNNEVEYKNNLETAEKMLKELIAKTEIVIRGEQEGIID